MDPYYVAQPPMGPPGDAAAASKAAAAHAAHAAHAAAAEAAGVAALPYQVPQMQPAGAPTYMHWAHAPMGMPPRAPPPELSHAYAIIDKIFLGHLEVKISLPMHAGEIKATSDRRAKERGCPTDTRP